MRSEIDSDSGMLRWNNTFDYNHKITLIHNLWCNDTDSDNKYKIWMFKSYALIGKIPVKPIILLLVLLFTYYRVNSITCRVCTCIKMSKPLVVISISIRRTNQYQKRFCTCLIQHEIHLSVPELIQHLQNERINFLLKNIVSCQSWAATMEMVIKIAFCGCDASE